MEGWKPDVKIGKGNAEAQKYGRMWAEVPAYRAVSPGEQLAQVFLAQARPKRGSDVIDFGCGTGRGALMLALLGGLRVTMIDFVRNSLDPEIQEALTTQAHALRFLKHDLEHPLPFATPYGYATDLMEHIPEVRVVQVLRNILMAAQHVFFSVSTVEDVCGAAIGERLHMTVQNYGWWLAQFNRLDCVIHWSKDLGGSCLFYVTAWQPGQAIVDAGVLNTEEKQVRENVGRNTRGGWAQVTPQEANDVEVMIVGGGPSLPAFEAEIRAQQKRGVKLVTLNGAYNWALEHGLTPSAQVIVDARAFNARFTKPVAKGCKYLIASQCDPSVLEGLPKDTWCLRRPDACYQRYAHGLENQGGVLEYATEEQARLAAEELRVDRGVAGLAVEKTSWTLLWHTSTEMIRDILAESYGTEHWRLRSPDGSWLSSLWAPRLYASEAEAMTGAVDTLDGAAEAVKLGRPDSEPWFGIPGGSTALLRAIPLLRMLGFKRFHLYGCDSCLEQQWAIRHVESGDLLKSIRSSVGGQFAWGDGETTLTFSTEPEAREAMSHGGPGLQVVRATRHHAYAQPENDKFGIIPVTCGGRVFACAPFMVSQAQEMMDLIKFLGDEIELEIHGDGLLAHILKTGATLDDEAIAAWKG